MRLKTKKIVKLYYNSDYEIHFILRTRFIAKYVWQEKLC